MRTSIQKWNPWWQDRECLTKIAGLERESLPGLLSSLQTPHIKDVIGVRRSGKTTLLYQVIKSLIQNSTSPANILYVNFDDPTLADLPKVISAALELNPDISHVFLDEIQQVPSWEKDVRTLYDKKVFRQVVVTGSSASLISRDIGRTLTGRHLTTSLSPFSFQEYLSFIGAEPGSPRTPERTTHHVEQYLANGGFPEMTKKDAMTRRQLLITLYHDIISRDLVSRFGLELDATSKIATQLLLSNGTPFSYSSIARATGIHYETVKKYVPLFEEVFLFRPLPFFSWKRRVTLKKDMKAYAIDTGLWNALVTPISHHLGRLAEHAVFLELVRRGHHVFFWKGKHEVDFVVQEGSSLTGINVHYANVISPRESFGLLEFKEAFKGFKPRLILITKDVKKDESEFACIPLMTWLMRQR